MRFLKNLLCFLILLLTALNVVAQQITGSIRGSIFDPSGAVVQDATVAAKQVETGLIRTVSSAKDERLGGSTCRRRKRFGAESIRPSRGARAIDVRRKAQAGAELHVERSLLAAGEHVVSARAWKLAVQRDLYGAEWDTVHGV
jgi:hypothetical protein